MKVEMYLSMDRLLNHNDPFKYETAKVHVVTRNTFSPCFVCNCYYCVAYREHTFSSQACLWLIVRLQANSSDSNHLFVPPPCAFQSAFDPSSGRHPTRYIPASHRNSLCSCFH